MPDLQQHFAVPDLSPGRVIELMSSVHVDAEAATYAPGTLGRSAIFRQIRELKAYAERSNAMIALLNVPVSVPPDAEGNPQGVVDFWEAMARTEMGTKAGVGFLELLQNLVPRAFPTVEEAALPNKIAAVLNADLSTSQWLVETRRREEEAQAQAQAEAEARAQAEAEAERKRLEEEAVETEALVARMKQAGYVIVKKVSE